MAYSVRSHFRSLPGQAGSDFRPILVSAHSRKLGEITRGLASAEQREFARLARLGVEAAKARRLAGLPALR